MRMFRIKNKNKNKKGFSLLEGVVATFLVTFGMIVVIKLISNTMHETMDTCYQISSSLLAQEGIEVVKNIRDNNWASGDNAFDSSQSNLPTNDQPNCAVTYATTDINNSDCNNAAGSFYIPTEDGGTINIQRKISLDYSNNIPGDLNRTLTVTSQVIWQRADRAFPSLADCNVNNNCTYTRTVLTQWH